LQKNEIFSHLKTCTYVLDRKRKEKREFGRPGSEGDDGMETEVT